ncbi:TPX2-like protein [Cynara cardunculus var. scolymus]|uniref:TPX2-like protein n=1 Tax=Cynara cardunculus var. scolymus TaxID=59895 RepID=A0A118JV33_CYNCS|nr:TPX2-like protein [Cynara cardunculus var. scolymus]
MESNGKNVGAVTLTPPKSKQSGKSKQPENVNPNVTSPNSKGSNSPAIKSATKSQKSATKKPNQIGSPSPRNKIRERKFVVAKKNSKREKDKTLISVDCKCKAGGNSNRCFCVAYETLRASQEEFFKNPIVMNPSLADSEVAVQEDEEKKTNGNPNLPEAKSEEDEVVEKSGEKRKSIPEPGSGRVMNLVKAFENILTLPKSDESGDKGQEEEQQLEDGTKRDSNWEFSSSSFFPSDLLITAESLGLRSRVSSSLDSSHGSIANRTSGGGRQSRRNSAGSSSSFGGSRWKRRTLKATAQQPFKLRTEQRGRSKQEEFMKKVQEMMIEQEKQRIPIAQGLPWTTDEPECLVKPPVKESTRPVDLVLHSDVRAVERAEFDHLVRKAANDAKRAKISQPSA